MSQRAGFPPLAKRARNQRIAPFIDVKPRLIRHPCQKTSVEMASLAACSATQSGAPVRAGRQKPMAVSVNIGTVSHDGARRLANWRRPADCKSAIQQIAILRYAGDYPDARRKTTVSQKRLPPGDVFFIFLQAMKVANLIVVAGAVPARFRLKTAAAIQPGKCQVLGRSQVTMGLSGPAEINQVGRMVNGCAVSSVVEHYLDTVGVGGSKPPPRTILFL